MWTCVETAKGLEPGRRLRRGSGTDRVLHRRVPESERVRACKLKTMSPARCDVGDTRAGHGHGRRRDDRLPSHRRRLLHERRQLRERRRDRLCPRAGRGSRGQRWKLHRRAGQRSEPDRPAGVPRLPPQTCDNLWCSAAPLPSTARRSLHHCGRRPGLPPRASSRTSRWSRPPSTSTARGTCIASAVCSGRP